MNIDLTMFHDTFFEEAADLISDFERVLLGLEDALDKGVEVEDVEMLNTIFRCAHSLKGGSGTFGFTEITVFTHGLETLLDRVRNRQVSITRSLTQLLFEALDQLKALLAATRGEIDAAPDASALRARIEEATQNTSAPSRAEVAGDAHRTYTASGEPTPAGMAAGVESTLDDLPAFTLPVEISTQPTGDDALAPLASPESVDDCWGNWIVPKTYRLVYKPGLRFIQQGNDPMLLITHLAGSVDVRGMTSDPPGVPAAEKTWTIEFVTEWEPDRIRGIFRSVGEDSDLLIEEVASAPSDVDRPAAAPEVPTPPPAAPEPAESPQASARPILPAPTASGRGPASTTKPTGRTASGADIQTLRVSTDKVDKLINLVGELVINQAILNDVIHDFTMDDFPRLVEAVSQMEHASRDLQERVMAVRMLPIKHAFGRFPRLVRDTAAAVGKQIELRTSGEDTELDKTVIEAIADPLTHLVRNSIDHGLETADERLAAGKPAVGVVRLDAFQEGGSIVVNVSDDGRGLNKNKIFQKAVERGLINQDEALKDEQIYDLIFEPGFSTADEVTNLSGRGVGMDIVKSTINGLGGSVTVLSTPGAVATFRIRLPLTVAILEGLSVCVGEEVYILPLTSVLENIRPRREDVSIVAGGSEVVQIRGEVLPLLRLYRIFGASPRETQPDRALLVVVENEGRKAAVLVDELITQSQIVIKSLETNYRKVGGIAGATILGDGRVALILDIPWLVRNARTRSVATIAV